MKHADTYKRLGYAVFLAGYLTTGVAFAQPANQGQAPTASGVVDWIDPEGKAIVINDRQYALHGSIRETNRLQPGTQIRFRYVRQADQKVITEILK